MATSGSTTLTKIASGSVFAGGAQPLPRTHLTIWRWARYAGINPVHFAGAFIDGYFPNHQQCSSYWPRHGWQASGFLSHEDLTLAILEAERNIQAVLGYSLAPDWFEEKVHFPKPYRRGVYSNGINLASQRQGVKLYESDYVIAGGTRAVELIEANASVALVDADGDGYAETAQVTVTTSYDPCEVGVFFPGMNGDERWEIRDRKNHSSSSGTVVVEFDTWKFIDPEVASQFPTTADEFKAINITNGSNLVTQVDVYRVYNDTTVASSLIWEAMPFNCVTCSGIGCAECTETTQDACLIIRDGRGGYVAPVPGAWTNGSFASAELTVNRSPDRVLVKYYAGHISEDQPNRCDPLDEIYARATFYLSMARLNRDICGCSNVIALSRELREPMATTSPEGNFLAISDDVQRNPFGTKRGEWLAYQMLQNIISEQNIDFALI